MGTLNEDLTSIKNIEDTLTANKVARFAYTDTAYADNDANGVDTYDFDKEQNIPNPTTSVLKVNSTVLDKGYRAQASSITRMLINHFFGRVSYNLNKVNDNMSALIATLRAHTGTANGFATLDANGRIPYSQLPESAVELKGYWNAQTNTPTLADGTGTNGDEYFVNVEGTQDLGSGTQFFAVGDRVLYLDGVWKNIASGNVRTVNEQAPNSQGNVTITLGKESLAVTKSFLSVLFGSQLGRVWRRGVSDTILGLGTPYEDDGIDPICYGKGVWLRLSINKGLYKSTDHVHWTKVSFFSDYFYKWSYVMYADGIFVNAVASDGLYWSEDGDNWTKVDINVPNDWQCRSLLYIDGIYFCLSSNYYLYWSEDGKNWTEVSTVDRPRNILHENNIWLCDSGYWSNDGKVWSPSSSGGRSRAVVYSRDLGLWVASNGKWSENGKTWTLGTGLPSSGLDFAVAYCNNVFVLGTQEQGLYYSYDGKSWSRNSQFDATEVVMYVKCLNGLWWCYSSGTSTSQSHAGGYLSRDGINWYMPTNQDGNPIDIKSIEYMNGLYLALIYRGLVWSVDGREWNKSIGISTASLQDTMISFCNGVWFLSGGVGAEGGFSSSIEELDNIHSVGYNRAFKTQIDLGEVPVVEA